MAKSFILVDEEQVGLCDAPDLLQDIRGSSLVSQELIIQSCLLESSTEYPRYAPRRIAAVLLRSQRPSKEELEIG